MSRFKPNCDHVLPEAMQPQCNGNCRKEPPTRKAQVIHFRKDMRVQNLARTRLAASSGFSRVVAG